MCVKCVCVCSMHLMGWTVRSILSVLFHSFSSGLSTVFLILWIRALTIERLISVSMNKHPRGESPAFSDAHVANESLEVFIQNFLWLNSCILAALTVTKALFQGKHIVSTVEDYTHLRKVLQIIKFKGYSKVKIFKFKIQGKGPGMHSGGLGRVVQIGQI